MATKASAKVVDFTNVKEGERTGINPKRKPEGDYLARVFSVQDAEVKSGDNAGDFQWLFIIALEDDPNAKYPYRCKLDANQLWKIRNLLQAAGINVPKKRVKLDPEKVTNKLIAVTLQDDEYNGKIKSSIQAIFSPADLEDSGVEASDEEDEEEEEETPAPAPRKKVKRKPEPEPEEDEDEEEEEEEPEPPKRRKKKAKPVEDDEMEELDIEDI